MKKTLTSLITSTILGLSSCVSNSTELKNDNFIYGNRLSSVRNSDSTYSIPTINLAGKGIVVPEISNRQEQGELPIIFTPYREGTWIVKDRDNKKIDLETKTLFITPSYFVGSGTDKKLATEVHFNREGKYGLKAMVDKTKGSESLGIRTFTHNDLTYEIPTLFIDTDSNKETPEEEFYIPIILEENKIKETLIVPVKGTKELIDPVNGNIMLRTTPGNIHQMKEISRTEYESRALTIKKEDEQKETALEIPSPAVIVK